MTDRISFPTLSDLGFVHDPPIVKLWNGLLTDSVKEGFERLHVTPPPAGSAEGDLSHAQVRGFKDGEWSEYFSVPSPMYALFVRRLKAIAGMALTRRLPVEQGTIRGRREGKPDLEFKVTIKINSEGGDEAIIEFPGKEAAV